MRINVYHTETNPKTDLPFLVKDRGLYYDFDTCRTPECTAKLMNNLFRLGYLTEEHVYMLAMNNSCKITGVFEISHGTALQSLCMPREILLKALLCGATGILLIHNHPGGVIAPSKDDIACARRLKEACGLIGIEFFDNLILSEERYYSFKSEKTYPFDTKN